MFFIGDSHEPCMSSGCFFIRLRKVRDWERAALEHWGKAVAHALRCCSVNPQPPHLPPSSSVVSGTQRLFSGSQSRVVRETATPHAPKSLHDFLIGGSGALRPVVLRVDLAAGAAHHGGIKSPPPESQACQSSQAWRQRMGGIWRWERKNERQTWQKKIAVCGFRLVGRSGEQEANVFWERKNEYETAERRKRAAPK